MPRKPAQAASRGQIPAGVWRSGAPYLLAAVATAGTFELRFALDAQLAGNPTLMLFMVPIMLSAYLGGLWPGLLAITMTFFGASYYLLPPIHSFATASSAERWQQVIVIVVGIFSSVLGEALHRSRARAVSAMERHRQGEAALKLSEERLRAYVEQAGDAILVHDFDGRFLDVNAQACTALGFSRDELLRMTLFDVIAVELDRAQLQAMWADLKPNQFLTQPGRHRRKDGSTFPVEVRLGCVVVGAQRTYLGMARDVTERVAHGAEIARVNRLYEVLHRVNEAMMRAPGREQLFAQVCRILVEQGAFRMAWIGWHRPESKLLVPVGAWGDAGGYLKNIEVSTDDRAAGRGPTGMAFRTGLPFPCNDMLNDPAALPWRAEAERHGLRSCAAFPVRLNGEVRGTLTVYSDEQGFFKDEEIDLLVGAAADVSFALENLEQAQERKRAMEATERALLRLTDAQRIGQIGDWEFDLASGEVTWSAQVFTILGRDPKLGSLRNYRDNSSLYEPASAALLADKVAAAIATGEPQEYDLVAPQADGRRVLVHAVAVPRKDAHGKVVSLYGTLQDITERKRTERAAQQLAAIVESSEDAIVGKDLWGIVTSWNAGAETLFGYTAAEMIGQSILKIIPPKRLEEEKRILAMIARGEPVRHFETVRLRKGGRAIDISVTVSAIKDAGGRIVGAAKVARDITRRKRIEAELRMAHTQLQRLLDFSPVVLYAHRLVGDKIVPYMASENVIGLMGFSMTELFRFDWWASRLHPEDRDAALAGMAETLKHGSSRSDYRLRHKDGHYINIEDSRRLVFDASGNPAEIVGAWTDITARKELERATRESEARYRQIFEHSPDGILLADAQGVITDANPSVCRLLKFTREDLTGLPLSALSPGPDALGGELRRKDGSLVPVEAVTAKIPTGEDLAIIRDISERLESRKALQLAEAAHEVKTAFLATMSHELRTPLNSILGFSGILLQGLAGPLNAEQSKQLEMVRGSARHLLELINDVLDISKLEAQQLQVMAAPLDLRASIRRAMALVGPLAHKKGLALAAVVDPAVGGMVSDRRRIEQILINLLNNAIKFTPSGSVTLTADIVEAPGPAVRLRVVDTGIGIQRNQLGLLFQPFRQIEGGMSRQNDGTGLGLAISHRLAGLLGGEISVASEWSKGSEFTLTLPLERAAAA